MVVYKKSISDLEALRAKNDSTIKNQLAHLGKQIALLADTSLNGTPFYESAKAIHALESQIAEKEQTIERWNGLGNELDTIGDSLHRIEGEIAKIKSELEPHYESIGDAALQAYLSAPEGFGDLSESAEQLVSIQDGIRDKERELQTLEFSEKQDSFLGKTLARGKGIVLRGSLKSKSVQRARVLRDIGERVCTMDMAVVSEAPSLAMAVSPVRGELEELGKLNAEAKRLEESRSKVHERRLEIEKQERMRNPVRNLGHEIERLKTQVGEIALELGTAYAESDKAIKDSGAVIDDAVTTIGRLNEENSRIRKVIERLSSAEEVEKLAGQIEAKRASRKKLEAEIASIDSAIEQIKAEKAVKTKARGSMTSLESELKSLIDSGE